MPLRPLAVCCVLVAFLFYGKALASPRQDISETPPPATGNPEVGRTLVHACMGCHGITGYRNTYPRFHVPKIGGQSAEYLIQALDDYRKGWRKNASMQAQTQRLSDQDIADIAAFLSKQP
jgi:cytochrome c553